jgi:valyl-tRNA synthetase
VDWLSEKRDWCISRQLWWGHRIPIWYCSTCSKDDLNNAFAGRNDVTWYHDAEQERWLVCADQVDLQEDTIPGHKLVQDPDVLDTWFSSALWPHSTMGWPEETAELGKYYPGSVLSTAREIITLWVARMVLTGMYNIGKVPFHDVYIHAVIQDGQGRPFKKTLGNGYDPVDIIEFYGADALRYTMATMTTETQDIRMPMKRVKLDDGRELQSSERFELGRNFCNKIWNAARFAFMNLENTPCATLDVKALPIEDRWILSRVSAAARDVQDALLKFQFSRAINTARDFFWDSLCDWYLELVKSRVKEHRQAAEAQQVLAFVLDQSLRLLHPFIPFITERIWAILNELVPQRGLPGVAEIDTDKPLIAAGYPPVEGWTALDDAEVDAMFDDLQTATRAVRDIRSKQNVPPRDSVDVTLKVPADRVASLKHEAHVIKQLANVGDLTIDPEATAPKNAATLVVGDMQIYVADVIDAEAERARLEKELANLDKQINGINGKLSNENFTARAPAEVVQRERDRLADLQTKRETVTQHIAELG